MIEGKISVAPSVICMDLCNLAQEVSQMEQLDVDYLHIDLVDGAFSPSMPIGIDTIRQLRKKTSMPFDVHIMANNNEFFIREMLELGVQRVCFHVESSLHVHRLLDLIRKSGVCAGIALNPSTSLSVLDYSLEECDYVMLMLINPGYAANAQEQQAAFAMRKIADLRERIGQRDIGIAVDGRVSLERIPNLVKSGAEFLVAGTSCLFLGSGSYAENLAKIRAKIEEGRQMI